MKKYFRQFGGKANDELVAQYAESDNWRDGIFQNFEPTTVGGSLKDIPRIIYKQFSNRKARVPRQPLPIIDFNRERFLSPSDKAKMIWYGHSVVMFRIAGKTILIDPMLGPNTSPIAPFATKRFSKNTLDLIDQFPEVDIILMTHDHYDHLDMASIDKLKHKTKEFYVALGVKRHLVKWGISEDIITEFDWWQDRMIDDLKITFTPTRHFSGRGLRDRAKTLWGGWVLRTKDENIWFSGDGGYGEHFVEIGERLGPFDFAFLECGQYNVDWHQIHLFPAEAVNAAIDAKVKKVMPVHWAGFALSYQHTWKEPAEDFLQCSHEHKLDYMLPKIGEQFNIGDIRISKWWESFE